MTVDDRDRSRHPRPMTNASTRCREILRSLSYRDELVREEIGDGLCCFVGHGHAPLNPRSACVAVAEAPADAYVATFVGRLGDVTAAPAVLVVSSSRVEWWCPDDRVPARARLVDSLDSEDASRVHSEWGSQLDPRSVMRARLSTRHLGAFQLSLFGGVDQPVPLPIDRSLLVRFEERQATRLAEFIDQVLVRVGETELLDTNELRYQAITLAFWIVASRILRDASVESFQGINYGDPRDVLGRVARHYNAAVPIAAKRQGWPRPWP